jgi:cytochrome P450
MTRKLVLTQEFVEYSDMPSREQTNREPTPLFKCLHEQIELMNRRSNEVRGFWYRRMPWHQLKVVQNNRTMHRLIEPYITAKRDIGTATTTKSTVVGLAVEHLCRNPSNPSKEIGSIDFNVNTVIISNIKAFLFAGQDTTAATICFLFKCLADNAPALFQMQAEHNEVLGANPKDAAKVLKASPHLLYKLPYTLSVIKETLRLYPLAASARDAPDFDMNLLISKEGESEGVSYYPLRGFTPWPAAPGIQRCKKYWPHPERFMPERWMAKQGEKLYPRKDAWMPFSLGPRNCIGMDLSLTILRLVCVFVARTFEFKEGWEEWDRIR